MQNHELIDVNSYPADPAILDIISEYTKIAERNMSEPLYQISYDLDHKINAESSLGNILADALMSLFDADFGMINSGVLNNTIPAGDISKKLLHEICPSPLEIGSLPLFDAHKIIRDEAMPPLDQPESCLTFPDRRVPLN